MSKQNQVCFGVSSNGNTKALLMCLSSVLHGVELPERIQVLFTGEFPQFGDFYLEQIAALASVKGVGMTFTYLRGSTVREARNWHLKNARTEFLWMGDDDVTYDPMCLYTFAELGTDKHDDFSFFVGTKADVNNRRGYPDFNADLNDQDYLGDGCSFNCLYNITAARDIDDFRSYKVRTLDTGNCFLNLPLINSRKIDFTPFEFSYNCGGEDTLFAMLIAKHLPQYNGYFLPQAIGYHLEKPASNFSEFTARGEMLLRAAEVLGLDKTVLDEFMLFIQPQQRK